jgi:hypothetical protein
LSAVVASSDIGWSFVRSPISWFQRSTARASSENRSYRLSSTSLPSS